MTERKDKKMVTDGFREYLSNRGLKETSVEDDIVRIKMMTSRYIDYTKVKIMRENCCINAIYQIVRLLVV